MQFDPQEMSVREIYTWMVGLITPRPIAWVSTISKSGVANLAPFSFFNGVGANPPTIMFCPANDRDGADKHTLANIRETREFVVNVVTEQHAEKMNLTAANLDADEDEFQFVQLAKAECQKVSCPRVAEAVAAFECTLHSVLELGEGPGGANLVIGQIVLMHVSDLLITPSGSLKAEDLDTIGRMGSAGYVRTTDRFDLPRPRR